MSFKEFIRLDNWWCSKIPPLLAVACLLILADPRTPWLSIQGLGYFLFSISCVAAYGHVVNDLFDLKADRLAGKPNAMARFRRSQVCVIAGALFLAGFVPVFVAGYSRAAQILLFLNYLWPTLYSIPGIRLKERGLWGVACDAAGSHMTPTAFALAVFSGPSMVLDGLQNPFPVLAMLWATSLGIKGILHHQAADRDNDMASGTVTFATVSPQQRIERLLPWYNLCIELPVSFLFAVSVYHICPLATVVFFWYLALEFIKYRLGFEFALTADHRRSSFPFVNEFFYVVWMPLAAVIQVAFSDLLFSPLPVLHVLVFLSAFKTVWSDLLNATKAMFQRLRSRIAAARVRRQAPG